MSRVLVAVAAGVAVALACQARAGGGAREFNGQTAFGYVQQQMTFGPRIPGTPAHRARAASRACGLCLTIRRRPGGGQDGSSVVSRFA